MDVFPPRNFSQPGAPLAAMVAGDSRFGARTGEWLKLSSMMVLSFTFTEGFTLGALQMEGEDVLRYLPSIP